jgi:hypothetical protein
MKLETGFRLSTYLTVVVASGCLAYAEEPYLPGIAFFALPLAAFLVLAYLLEGRWSLSAQGANGLGLLISVGWVAWVIFFSDEFEDPLGRPPWPAVFLPYLGPLLMVLLLVKLFRPKGIKDYWYIHAIGLIEIAVACVLVVEPYFGTMLFGYILCAFWSLTLFYSHRESVKARESSLSPGEVATAMTRIVVAEGGEEIPWRYLGCWLAARKALAVVAVSLVLFFLTPQHGTTEAMSFFLNRAAHAQTGFANAPIDLKASGQLEVDETVAFEVYVENADGTPKTNLNPGIRWRGTVQHHYSKKNGSWMLPSQGNYPTAFQPQASKDLPDLGNEQYYITFQGNTRQSHGLFLAEPIVMTSLPNKNSSKAPAILLPYVSRTFEGLFGYDKRADRVSGIVPLSPMDFNYQQVTRPARGDGLSDVIPVFAAAAREIKSFESAPKQAQDRASGDDSFEDELQLTPNLLEQPVQGIRDWTGELLNRLIQQGKLNKEDLSKEASWPKEHRAPLARSNRAKVARALSDYLTSSGEYVYSLHLAPLNSTTGDPTEDFLRNVKQGHCERFATGLALMLRSAGIPCRVVAGFRGADLKDPLQPDNGWYVVRHNHAHAWVEALVGHRNQEGKMELRWLTLDPSPLQENDTEHSLSLGQWWERSLQFLRSFWRLYILEYNTEQQGEAIQALWSRVAPMPQLRTLSSWVQQEPYWLAGFAVLLVGLVWLRRPRTARRQGTVPAAAAVFYHRLLTLMERRCRLTPEVGQTPREFGVTAQQFLSAQRIETALKDLPLRIIELFYQVRYGGMKIPLKQLQEIDRQLDFLNTALKNGPRLAN